VKSKKEDEKLGKSLTEKEQEVAIANIRAGNNWGRVWRLERRVRAPDARTSRLMKTRAFTYRKMYLDMISSLGELRNKSVLDVGCGTSDYLIWLANDCANLVGVDISIEMLKLSREVIGKSFVPIAADALHLPFREGVFDMSTTFQALHHFPNWRKALVEMVRTAKQVSLYEPNSDSFLHRLANLVRQTFRVERRFKQIDEEYGLVEFQASGFSPVKITAFLNGKGMNVKTFMFGLFPVSLLEKFYWLSPLLFFFVLTAEDTMRRVPIIQNQLGGMLITAWNRDIELNGAPMMQRAPENGRVI